MSYFKSFLKSLTKSVKKMNMFRIFLLLSVLLISCYICKISLYPIIVEGLDTDQLKNSEWFTEQYERYVNQAYGAFLVEDQTRMNEYIAMNTERNLIQSILNEDVHKEAVIAFLEDNNNSQITPYLLTQIRTVFLSAQGQPGQPGQQRQQTASCDSIQDCKTKISDAVKLSLHEHCVNNDHTACCNIDTDDTVICHSHPARPNNNDTTIRCTEEFFETHIGTCLENDTLGLSSVEGNACRDQGRNTVACYNEILSSIDDLDLIKQCFEDFEHSAYHSFAPIDGVDHSSDISGSDPHPHTWRNCYRSDPDGGK